MATLRQRKAVKNIAENGGNVSKAMREAGYTDITSATPKKLTTSKGWKELMDQYLGDEKLSKVHDELLKSTHLDHMTFPTGPIDDHDVQKCIDADIAKAAKEGKPYEPKDYMTDDDIKDMLKGVSCTVRRIVHGETARHVYFWAADSKARKEGLDMAYKLKGKYAPEKVINLNMEISVDDKDLSLAQQILEQRHQSNKGGGQGGGTTGDGTVSEPVGGEVQD